MRCEIRANRVGHELCGNSAIVRPTWPENAYLTAQSVTVCSGHLLLAVETLRQFAADYSCEMIGEFPTPPGSFCRIGGRESCP